MNTPTPPEVVPAQVGGVVVTQADISAAKPIIIRVMIDELTAQDLHEAFARHRLATIEDLAAHHAESLAVNYDQARATAIEECARVAESRHEHWCEPGDHAVECDVSACRDIATAIRQLSAPPPPPVDVGEGEDG